MRFNALTLKKDIPSSIVVFLVALPLCLGVALASGAPLISGIISGIVGGIVVGLLSKSETSVSGPAAGLAAVVLSSIQQLGSFELFLTAVVLAGVFQVAMGMLKFGIVANYIPNNVIKGLLAAIGIILILKQIPHAIGFDRDAFEDFSFIQSDGKNTFSEIWFSLPFFLPGAIVISTISLMLLIFWPKTPMAKLKFLPASLFVVVLGVVLNLVFNRYVPYLAIHEGHMVNIPPFDTENLGIFLNIPRFDSLLNPSVLLVALTVAIIASLETLLNIEAVDKLDPHKRETPPNRELVAQGVGNMFSGILGGIPVTSVIVRSSVNIQSGNETKLSSILHGIFMLLSVLALSPYLNLIPLASLAAILLITGYKLAGITLFKDMFKKGWVQFLPFIITILAIVFTDLLIGVIMGLLVSIFHILMSNFRNPFVKEEDTLHIGDVIRIELPNLVTFFNKASIKDSLWRVPHNTKVIIDASYSNYIDYDVLEIIDDFKTVVAPERGIQLNLIGLKEKYQLNDYIQFINILDKETQQKLTPAEVLQLLKIGNDRFVQGRSTNKYHLHQVSASALGQNPMAVLVGCIDSRTSPELLFDAGIGDLLTIRIAGNIVSPEIIGSLEIAVKKLGAKLIVVKGHSNCGAVSLSLANVMDENIGAVTSIIQEVARSGGFYPKPVNQTESENLEKVIRANALHSVEEIKRLSPFLKEKIETNEIGIVSAYHELSTGRVYFDE